MANTYKWVVSSLNAKIKDGELEKVIETIHWRLQAESEAITDEFGNEQKITADVYGSVGLDAPEGDFIAFEDLTQADVEAWLEAKLDVDSLKVGLDAQIEAIKNPTHVSLNLVAE